MTAEKFSVSFGGNLAATVRKAAAKEGLSISSWLAEAAAAKARQEHLRSALDAFASEHGSLEEGDVEDLVRKARKASRITGANARNGRGKSASRRSSRKAA